MELNIQKDTHSFYSRDKWMPITKLIPSVFLGIGLGGILFYCLIKQFYFYQVIVVAILCVPVALLFLVYSPRRSLLGILILIIPFNPCFNILRDDQIAFGPALKFWTSDLIVIIIFFLLIISYAFGRKNRQHPHSQLWWSGLPLLIWIAAGVVSILPAANKGLAIVEMIRMFRIFLIFVAIYLLVERFEDIRFIATCLVIAFAIQVVLVFAEYGLSHPLFRLPGGVREADIVGTILRPDGTMGHSSDFAKFAALSLPICLALIFVVRKNIWRICAGSVLIGGLVSLVLTLSRAGLATTLFGLAWVFLVMKKKRRKEMITLVSFSFLIIGIGLSLFLGGHKLKSRFGQDFGSALSRPQMFSVAWNVIKDHPFVGVGLNNYTLVAPDYDHTRDAISISFPHPVHNIYLLHAAEIGIPGAICFIWFLVSTIGLAFKYSSETGLLLDSAITKAIGIGITCSWLQGLISWGFRASIVHVSYLAVFAGAFAGLRYYNQNRCADHVDGR